MNSRKYTSVHSQLVRFKNLLLIHVIGFSVFWIDFHFTPKDEKDRMHEEILQKHAEDDCHLYEQRLREELEEKIMEFENDPLYSGTISISKAHQDRLNKKVTEVGYGITPGEIADAKRFGILPKEARLPTKLTKVEADEWFKRITMPTYTKCVEKIAKSPITFEQKFALISFCHNLGCENLKKLLRHNPDEIGTAIRKYCYASGKKCKGLEKRRKWEADLWESGLKKSEILASR